MSNNLGARLKSIRGKESRNKFAQRIGISARALINYESGLREPKASIIEQICERLGINRAWLLSGETEGFINKNCRHVGENPHNTKIQPIEILGKDFNENCRQSAVLELQQEIIELLKEKNALTEKTASLQIQLKERDQRIKELEKEIERLRGELSLAKSRAAGAQAG